MRSDWWPSYHFRSASLRCHVGDAALLTAKACVAGALLGAGAFLVFHVGYFFATSLHKVNVFTARIKLICSTTQAEHVFTTAPVVCNQMSPNHAILTTQCANIHSHAF